MGQAKQRGTYEERVQQAKAKTTNTSANLGWSEQHYNGLTADQHKANNEWFAKTQSLLNPGGHILVPSLGKSFTK